MNVALIIFAALCTSVGAVGALMLFVFVLAMGANSTPAQITQIKLGLLAIAICGAASIAGAIGLMVVGHAGWASFVGILPALALLGLFVYCEL